MNWTKFVLTFVSLIALIGGVILFANVMVKRDDNSTYNLDKDARALCKELNAEFRKVGHDRICIRNGEVVWP